jgi:hypothetical protein
MMIGNGTPNSHSNAPRPKPMRASYLMGIETITGAASSSVSLGQGVAIAKAQVEGGTSRRFLPWVRQNLFLRRH